MGSVTYLGDNRPGRKVPQPHSVIFGRNLRQNGPDWTLGLTPSPPQPPQPQGRPPEVEARHAQYIALIQATRRDQRTPEQEEQIRLLGEAIDADHKIYPPQCSPEVQAEHDRSVEQIGREMSGPSRVRAALPTPAVPAARPTGRWRAWNFVRRFLLRGSGRAAD